MERITLQVGTFEVNCSILAEAGKAWIVDPGNEGERIAETLVKRSLTPAGILLTHAHFDHIGGIPALQKAVPALPVYVNGRDVAMFGHSLNQLPPDYPKIAKPQNLRGLEDLKDLKGLEVIETPGHTPGGLCYFFRNFFSDFPDHSKQPRHLLLSGDTLFAGSVGRTDLPGGDMDTLINSLKKLIALPDDTLVIPGHGPFTTIGEEKRNNPFLH